MPSSSRPSMQRSRRLRHAPKPNSADKPLHRKRQALPPVTDPAKRLAMDLIVRAVRQAGAHNLLRGGSGAIALIVRHAQDLTLVKEASETLLLRARREWNNLDLIIEDRNADAVRIISIEEKLRWTDADAAALLAKHRRVLVLATADADIPSFFRQAAEAVVPLAPCDSHALRGMLYAFFGQAPAAHELPDVSGLSITAVTAALRTRASLSRALASLSRVAQAPVAPTESVRYARTDPTLAELAGLGEVAEWGQSLVVDWLAYRAKEITWAEMPKGAVMHGNSGTGKTTAAKAIARSCNAPIFIHSLARWQAMGHLGDLLKAMRKAFDEAKRTAPCILFLDEIDSFGNRSQFIDARNEQYCREVVNGFLECLDGADGREGVVVIGATNYPDKIDPAILRSGRLERLIAIPLPDATARAAILRFHLAGLLEGADLMPLSRRLEGLSGADLEKIVRDARRKARLEKRLVTLDDLNASTPQLIALSEDAYHRTCLHEAAHALVGCLVMSETSNPPLMARVFREAPPGLPAGETMFGRSVAVPLTRAAYLGDITALLAGMAAETLLLGEHCSGSGGRVGSDLHHATRTALAMEASIGMGQSIAYRGGLNDRDFLSLLNADTDLRARVEETLLFCRKQAESLLAGHRAVLLELTETLADKGQIAFAAIKDIVQAHRPDAVLAGNPGEKHPKPAGARRRRAKNPSLSRESGDAQHS
ncbi:AAA family ATPase [Microvirga sp. BT688]|uniref:AAA family ATPase n=1 Tax=Microvirga sp. TaxID=1873136 RepID=UPI001685AC8F|nr:AAA family ATPase [Microvirga sp.]MBD2746625.1 AAA family ATPase [Microvirga sp.]